MSGVYIKYQVFYNTTLSVREGLHGREIAGVCGLCDEVEEDRVGSQVGLGSPREEGLSHL